MLSWVNVARPPPQHWFDTFETLLSCLRCFIELMPPSDRSKAEQILEKEITLEFFISMLSRLHINSFR